MPSYYSNAKAVVFPQEEDFGIVPVEAMASGIPVIAYRAGGALETVKNGETGAFFNEQTIKSLAETVERFNPRHFDSRLIRLQALKFDKEVFKEKIKSLINL